MKILCSADLHLGRRATHLAPGLSGSDFSAAAGWLDLVDFALREQVSAVLLAGDVVERDNRFFEAWAPLEKGISRLLQAGTEVYAVAGNHDSEVLGRLADSLPDSGFHLLGRNGRWEETTVAVDGTALLALYGWSFPSTHVHESPLASCPIVPQSGPPALVMVHGDLDQKNSPYAPLVRADMERVKADFWLLGHIHQPGLTHLAGTTPVLYPGSPLALDPGEHGAHGPWMLELQDGRLLPPEQVNLSRMRYERLEFDISHLADDEAFGPWLLPAMKAASETIQDGHEAARCLSFRVTLTGRTPLHGRLSQIAGRAVDSLADEHGLDVRGVPIFLDRFECRTSPHFELSKLAAGTTPVALLARLLLDLDSDSDSKAVTTMVEVARNQLRKATSASVYAGLDPDGRSVEHKHVRDLIRKQGLVLLDRLWAQKESA